MITIEQSTSNNNILSLISWNNMSKPTSQLSENENLSSVKQKRKKTSLGRITDVLQCFNSHGRTDSISNAWAPVTPQWSSPGRAPRPQLYHCPINDSKATRFN